MAVTVEREQRKPTHTPRSLSLPLWMWPLGAIALLIWRYGLQRSQGYRWHLMIAADPFSTQPDSLPWLYQSPLGYLAAWGLRLNGFDSLVLFHVGLTITTLLVIAYAMRTVNATAARLAIAAYVISQLGQMAVTKVGAPFDLINVAALTVAYVIGPGVGAFAVGATLGFNHFEQGFIGVAVIAALHQMRGQSLRSIAWLTAGSFVGKLALLGYQMTFDLPTDGRWQFLRQAGISNTIDGWKGQLPVLIWSCYGVMWFALLWMAAHMERRNVIRLAAMQVALLVPVLLTYDLTRVYVVITWPIVLFACQWFAERCDSRRLYPLAFGLVVLSLFLSTPWVWHATGVGAEHWFR